MVGFVKRERCDYKEMRVLTRLRLQLEEKKLPISVLHNSNSKKVVAYDN